MFHLLIEGSYFKFKDKKNVAKKFNKVFKDSNATKSKTPHRHLFHDIDSCNLSEEQDIELILSSLFECDVELFDVVPTIIFSDAVDPEVFEKVLNFVADQVENSSYITTQDLNTHQIVKYNFHDGKVFKQEQKMMWDKEKELVIKSSEDLV